MKKDKKMYNCPQNITNNKFVPVDVVIQKHKNQPDALIRVLQEVYSLLGRLPGDVLDHIATGMEIPIDDIRTLVSVFPELKNKNGNGQDNYGRHKICVCKGTSCYIRGSNEILERISKELNVEPGGTTSDGQFSVEVVRCIGACALGPVITVDDAVHPRIKPEKISEILDKYCE